MPLTSNWKVEIKQLWSVSAVQDLSDVPEGVLWTSRCSRTKKRRRGRPHELYVSPLNRHFYAFARNHGLRYGILSDKYGLHMDDERLSYYDVSPSDLRLEEKRALGVMIHEKATELGFEGIVFYNNAPLMSVPYFQMLCFSGMPSFFLTRLPKQPHEASGLPAQSVRPAGPINGRRRA